MTVPSPPSSALKLVPALCPLCGIEDVDPWAVGEDFEYRTSTDTFLMVRCRHCRVLYLNPRPALSELRRVYPDNYHAFQFDAARYGFIHSIRRRLEAQRIRRWTRGLPRDARILDVGCGDGFHLSLLRDYGRASWSLEGLDADERAVTAARERGFTVRQAWLDEQTLTPDSYDLILLVMTIEHLYDPVQTLRLLRAALKPGGRLGIITDNAASPDAKLFAGRHWGGYHFPRHTVLFDRVTLARSAEQADLAVERIRSSYSPVNWTYSLRNMLDDWRAPRWLVNQFSLEKPIPLAAFTLLDLPLALFGAGAILVGSFRKTGSSP